MEKGQFDDAIADFNKALELIPNDAFAYKQRGFAKITNYEKFQKGDLADALADFKKFIKLKPNDDADAYKICGDIEGLKGDINAAQADFKEAIKLNPKIQLSDESKKILTNGINSN